MSLMRIVCGLSGERNKYNKIGLSLDSPFFVDRIELFIPILLDIYCSFVKSGRSRLKNLCYAHLFNVKG